MIKSIDAENDLHDILYSRTINQGLILNDKSITFLLLMRERRYIIYEFRRREE